MTIHGKNVFRVQVESEVAVKLELLGLMEAAPGWQGRRHAHSFHELVYVESGTGTLVYGGKKYRMDAGGVFLLAPHIEHQFIPDANIFSRHLYFGFSLSGKPSAWSANIKLPVLDKQNMLAVIGEFRRIVSRITQTRQRALLNRCLPDALRILLKFLDSLANNADGMDEILPRSEILVAKAKNFLAANLQKNISVRDVAASFYISPHYFGNIFKQHAGMTVKEYHEFLRFRAAERMLRDPDLQITQIADKLGYNGIHYFSRKFKQYHGLSPSALRANLAGRLRGS